MYSMITMSVTQTKDARIVAEDVTVFEAPISANLQTIRNQVESLGYNIVSIHSTASAWILYGTTDIKEENLSDVDILAQLDDAEKAVAKGERILRNLVESAEDVHEEGDPVLARLRSAHRSVIRATQDLKVFGTFAFGPD